MSGHFIEKDTPVKLAKMIARFWAKVSKLGPEDCWIWIGTGHGRRLMYGEFRFYGIPTPAHRVSWIIHNGPIPDGLHVLHNCPEKDNSRCVNPSHLYLGTEVDNTRDRVIKKQMNPVFGEKNLASKLTDKARSEVFDLKVQGWTRAQLARWFGVSGPAISQILKRGRRCLRV